jgi:hypothetical protein
MHHLAGVVAQHLHLDVPGVLDVTLDVEATIAEVALRLAARALDLAGELFRLPDDAHPLAAAAGGRLDQQRKPHLQGPLAETGRIVVLDGRGRHRKAGLGHEGARPYLVAHQVDGLGAWSDEADAGGLDLAGECGVLGQESVARMDRTGPRRKRGVENGVAVEVGRHRSAAVQLDRLIGLRHGRRQAVQRMMNHHGTPQPLRLHAAQDAQGDFARLAISTVSKGHVVMSGSRALGV